MSRKLWDRFGICSGVIAILGMASIAAYLDGSLLAFNPINGHFQNYNMVHRLSLGQIPFLDFPVYLGFGPLLAGFPLFIALGGDLSASNMSFDFLGHVLPAVSVALTILLCRGGNALAWPFAALTMMIPNLTASGHDSAISVRSFLPVLAAFCVLWLYGQRSPRLRSKLLSAIGGAIVGAMPLWSNDYGLPTAAVLTLVLAVGAWNGTASFFQWVGVFLLSAIVSFSLLLFVFTWGHPSAWFAYTARVSEDQFWYFLPDAAGKTYDISDIPHGWNAVAAAAPTIATALFWLFRGRGDRVIAALAALACATLGACLLSGTAGTFMPRYALPLLRLDVVLVPFLVARTLSACIPWLSPRFRVISDLMAASSLPLAISLLFLVEIGTVWPLAEADALPVVELGGVVPQTYKSGIELGRRLGVRYDTEGVPADRRLLSTYATAIAYLAGSVQQQPDYIIHALGQKGRNSFIAALDQGYRNVETIDPRVLNWGLWNVRTSWPFFRKLFTEWHPSERSGWSLIWERRAQGLPTSEHLSCNVSAGPSGFSVMTVNGNALRQDSWVEVTPMATSTLLAGSLPLFGRRGLIEAVENPDLLLSRDTYAEQDEIVGLTSDTWSAPLDASLTYPVRLMAGANSSLALRAWPRDRASLTVTACSAKVIATIEQTTLPEDERRAATLSYLHAAKIQMPPLKSEGQGGPAWVIYLRNMTQLKARVGDVLDFGNRRKAIVLLRDFGKLVLSAPAVMELSEAERLRGGTVQLLTPPPL